MSREAGPGRMADLHCHFVPGVDDGAPDLEAALRWLGEALEGGVERVATTPHLPARRADAPYRRRAEEAFRGLKEACREELPGLELRLAFELRLDGAAVDPGDRGLWLGAGGHVLVEYGAFSVPDDPVAPMAELLDADRTPVLAHPERFRGAGNGLAWARAVRSAGVRTAVNAGSLLGSHGGRVARTARRMLAEGLVDLVASDHHARPGRSDGLPAVRGLLARADPAAARRLLWENPRAVLDGETMAAPPCLELPGTGGRAADTTGGRRGGTR